MGKLTVLRERASIIGGWVGERDTYDDIDDLATGLNICSGDDCRNPRQGPYVIDLNAANEGPRCLCYWCFATEVLGVDPADFTLA